MYSNLRIGGLASGMDIDQLVSDLMKVQRMRVDKLGQDKQILEWQREEYRELNNSLRALRDSAFNMKLQGTFLAKGAVSTHDALTVSAGTNAQNGTYSVTVHNLATGVSRGSQEALAEEVNSDGTIKTLSEQFGISGTIDIELAGSKGSQSFSFDTAQKTINDVVSEINKARIGIVASYDTSLNRFFLTTDSTGSDAKIQVVKDDANFLSSLESGNNTLKLNLSNDYIKGTNALVDFGDVTGLEFQTNTFMINGITITASEPDVNAEITVSSDTDRVVESIKSFIELYNSTIDNINKKINEKRYRDYLPLTDEQREQLSDEQEKKWEEKARSGLLKNDALLSGAVYKMRASMSAVVEGVFNTKYDTLAEIGITTGDYAEKGKLHLDEEKLKEALVKDPRAVMELFTNSSDNAHEKGIAIRLYNDITASIKSLTDKAGMDIDFSQYDNSVIGKQIERVNKDIDRWEDKLKTIEDRYWRQFTAMEKAIQQMNSQSMWLSNQLGNGQ